jgi:hypothetical protein
MSPQHGTSSGCEWREGLKLRRVAANILNKKLRTNYKGLGVGLTTLHCKK